MENTSLTNLQILSETIANVIDLDVEIVDGNLRRIAGTGNMSKSVGAILQSGWLNQKVLNTGKKIICAKPGHDEMCDGCQIKRDCIYQVGMLAPIVIDCKVIGVINFVGFTNKQHRIFKSKQEIYQKFLLIISQLLTMDILSIVEPFKVETAVAGIIENLEKGFITVENEGKISYISERAKKILDKYPLFNEKTAIQKPAINAGKRTRLEDLVGISPKLELIKKQINILANQDTTVMIQGESGTGKELVARIIHSKGKRSQYPFVDVNCAALPDNLVESELFGYMDGAFTGARKGGSVGKIEFANKGTLFLDEIGDMSNSVQAKLLRVLEERELYRVGSNKLIQLDTRIITATNKNLWELVQKGQFRQDLFYRINVAPMILPRLEERKGDIPELVSFYIKHYCLNAGRRELSVDKMVMKMFLNYHWPGNIRELRNVVEYCVIFSEGDLIDINSLPYWFTDNMSKENTCLDGFKEDAEKEFLLQAYQKYGHDKKKMANFLNISLTTLYRKLNKYHLM